MSHSRNPRVVAIVLVISIFFLWIAFLTGPLAQAFLITFSELDKFLAPFGNPIPKEKLDGIIGPEWDDAEKVTIQLGRFHTDLLQKNDGRNLYIAMEIKTNRRYHKFEGFVFFDNGDRAYYTVGDDIISVIAKDGKLVEADYYYRGRYNFRLDKQIGGVNNAFGAGKYDTKRRVYVFEFMRELNSGDNKDVNLNPGDVVTVAYGWAY